MRGEDAPFYVWCRDDGYLSCTRYDPGKGFDILLTTSEWAEARDLIEQARTARDAS